MTCKDVGLCLKDACSLSNFRSSIESKDSSDEDRPFLLSFLRLLGVKEQLDKR